MNGDGVAVDRDFRTGIDGLYVVGRRRTGRSQAIIPPATTCHRHSFPDQRR
ncbi:MAG: hypothetical protein M9927_14910 [Anaerolineae bacterium]|nr:hypothetical protein [Anaerolineae bacterium]